MKIVVSKYIKTIFFLCIIILSFEFFLRLTEITLPSHVYDDPKFGRIHNPGSDYFEILNEGFGFGEVNKFGYLGPAYPKHKDHNTLRIALVGDSFVEGIQVFDRQHYRYILEKRLSELLDQKVEVLNFGVGGHNLRDIYINFKNRVLEYNPDIMLIFIREGNFAGGDINPGPDLKLENDSLVIGYEFKNTRRYKLRMKFKLLRDFSIGYLIKESYEEYAVKNYRKVLFGKFYDIFKSKESTDKSSESIDNYYNINRVILKKLSDYNITSKKVFIVKKDDYSGSYNNLISKLDLPIIDLNSLLFKHSKGTKTLNYWKGSGMTGHWNYKGHSVIGHYLADYIYNYLSRGKINLDYNKKNKKSKDKGWLSNVLINVNSIKQ